MGCDEAVYLAFAVVIFEFWYRLNCDKSRNIIYLKDIEFQYYIIEIYVIFYVLSICSTILYVSALKCPSLPRRFEPYIPMLYTTDSVAAICLGYSLLYENKIGVVLSMIVLTNFFLLHILHNIFSKKPGSLVSISN